MEITKNLIKIYLGNAFLSELLTNSVKSQFHALMLNAIVFQRYALLIEKQVTCDQQTAFVNENLPRPIMMRSSQ